MFLLIDILFDRRDVFMTSLECILATFNFNFVEICQVK